MKLAYDAAYRNVDGEIQKFFHPLQTETSRHNTKSRLDFRFPAPHTLGIITKSVCRRAATLWNTIRLEQKAASSRNALTRALKTDDVLKDGVLRFQF